MQRKNLFLLSIVVTIFLIGSLLFIFKRPPLKNPDIEVPVPAVAIYYVLDEQVETLVEAQGMVQPSKSIDVIARVAGVVDSVSPQFAKGGFFGNSEQLLSVEDNDYRYALIRAEARLSEAKKTLAIEKGQSLQAQREWRDLGDDEANALFLRQPQLDAAEGQVASAQADVDQAKLELDRTKVIAPFDSIISEKFVEIGEYVTPGQKIAEIYGTDSVEVRLPLTDRQVRLVELPSLGRATKDIFVTLEGVFGGQVHNWEGKLTRVEASLNIDSQTVFAVVEVDDPYSISDENRTVLPIGLFVNAEIRGESIPNSRLLPRSALKPGNVLYVMRKGRLELLEAEVLQANDESVLLIADLLPGEAVVLSQMPYAVPGMKIRAITESRS